MSSNFLFADAKSLFFQGGVFLHRFFVFLSGGPQHSAQRLDQLFLWDLVVGLRHFPVFNPPGSFHNYKTAFVYFQIHRVKIIDFAHFFETNSNNFRDNPLPISSGQKSSRRSRRPAPRSWRRPRR